jgi:hypothetical protein
MRNLIAPEKGAFMTEHGLLAEIEWLDGSTTKIAKGNKLRDPQDGTFVVIECNAEGKHLAAHKISLTAVRCITIYDDLAGKVATT